MLSSEQKQFKDALKKEPEYIDSIIKNLQKNHPSYANEVIRRKKNVSEYLGIWYELMVYDWLCKQGKKPSPQPFAPDKKSKPDFVYKSNDINIYIDVASVQESKNDEMLCEKPYFINRQATSSFAAMRERLLDKLGKHKSIADGRDTYVICLGLESSYIDVDDVITCFIGNRIVNILGGKDRTSKDGDIYEQENNRSLLVKYKSVSAILVAKRNYTLAEDRNKLAFWLIQNPYANTKIPPTEFDGISRWVVLAETDDFLEMGWQN